MTDPHLKQRNDLWSDARRASANYAMIAHRRVEVLALSGSHINSCG